MAKTSITRSESVKWRAPADRSLVLIDGHTRYLAAEALEINTVRCFIHPFTDEETALDYARHNQRDRRNLTDAEILRHVAENDARKREGRPSKETPQPCGESAVATAAALGVSPRKVEQARTVLDHAPAETRDAVLAGDKTINAAYNETQQFRRDTEDKARDQQPHI